MFVLTALLWRLAQPNGRHTGWASPNAHADEVRAVRLYEHYAQVYLDHAKVFLGLVSDADTQRHMEQFRERYHDAVVTAAGAPEVTEGVPAGEDSVGGPHTTAGSGRASSGAALRDRPAELPVTMRGRPWAEQALEVIGILVWLAPLLYFPVVGVRTARQYAAAAGQSGEATRGLLKSAETLFKLETHSPTRFRDVAGMKEAKREITEIVDFLRQPERFTRLGAKIPTGALLLGPPGTGKTLLARAVAGESGVGFIAACGSDFVELYVGMGALRVRKLFEQAKKQRCIVYIDEIDAIGLKRQGSGHGERQEQELTLNELLTQLDGFQTGRRGEVMVLASTNVAQEALDPALIRPGRFDRIIHIDAPVLAEREDIFRVHLSHLRLIAPASAAEDATPQSDAAPSQDCAKDNAVAATSLTSDTADSAHATVEPSAAVASSSASTTADTITTTTTTTTTIKEEEASTVTASAAVSSVAPHEDRPAEIVTTAAASESNTERQTVVPSAFDIEAVLAGKTAEERALIDRYAARMSQLCPGFVGADVANVCNEAAILAAREDASHVELSHLERSIDRVLAGIEHRSRALSAFEKDVVAHHEAGHAVAGWFLRRADPLMKVSIVPRSGAALGYAQYLPNENRNQTAQEMRDAIAVALAGRIAEEIFFHHWSTGAADDLRKVGQMAYDYVAAFQPDGVSAAYPPPGSHATRYVRPFGAKTADALDTAAKRLVDEVYAATKELLLAHKTEMEQLARHLLAHEVLTYKELVGYLGVRGERPSDRRTPLSA